MPTARLPEQRPLAPTLPNPRQLDFSQPQRPIDKFRGGPTGDHPLFEWLVGPDGNLKLAHIEQDDIAEAFVTILERVHLPPAQSNAAHPLDWNAVHKEIEQEKALREAFEDNLNKQLKNLFGKPISRDQLLQQIEQAEAQGKIGVATQMRRDLFIANEYAVVETLNVVNSERYRKNRKGKLETYCNVYAYDVVTALGGYLPRVWWTDGALQHVRNGKTVEPIHGITVLEMRANELTGWMHTYGDEFGWRKAKDANAAQEAANNGRLVIALAKSSRTKLDPNTKKKVPRSGHVSIIMPETPGHEAGRPDGVVELPLQTQAGDSNFNARKHKQWWNDHDHKEGAAWIFEGFPISPLLTPKQLGSGI